MVTVLNRSGAVILHPAKTGGTWVREALTAAGVPWRTEGPSHLDRSDAAEISPGAPRLATVRSPFAWYASFWAHRMQRGWGGDLPPGHDCISGSFGAFVRSCARKHPGWLTDYLRRFDGPDVRWLRCGHFGTADLARALSAQLLDLGEEHDSVSLRLMPPVNRCASLGGWAERSRWDAAAAALICRLEEWVFDRFGFDQDGWRTQP